MEHFRMPIPPHVAPGEIRLDGDDMTLTCAADVTLRQIQETLADVDQWLAIDGAPDTQVGTLVEQDSTGILRQGFGGWRDQLLGIQFRDSAGLVTAGGGVVKNVAGYDLTKLFVGSRGRIGRAVTLKVRTTRRPDAVLRATFPPDAAMASELLNGQLAPHYVLLSQESLVVGYVGSAVAIEFYRQRLSGLGSMSAEESTVEQDIDFRAAEWSARTGFRVSVPPLDAKHFVEQAGIDDWRADAMFGIIVGTAHDSQKIASAAESCGGYVISSDSPGENPRDLIRGRVASCFL
jgi:FAD/FMN-containing dehydrogenase